MFTEDEEKRKMGKKLKRKKEREIKEASLSMFSVVFFSLFFSFLHSPKKSKTKMQSTDRQDRVGRKGNVCLSKEWLSFFFLLLLFGVN